MPTLSLFVLGASREALATFALRDVEADEIVMVANPGGRYGGYSALANWHLRRTVHDIVGFVHADLILGPGMSAALVAAAAQGAVAGIVGRAIQEGYVWCKETPPGTTRPVSTLDSCSLFVSRALAAERGLAFDEVVFDSYHCCVEDFCLQAALQGIPIVVASGPAEHGGGMSGTPEGVMWRFEYSTYRARLDRKWGAKMVFVTT